MVTTEPKIGRATPLAPDDRRSAIIDAVVPLILERGRDVTSREMAEAAGVAEGTIFRAFGDKDSVIQAAVDRFLDPVPFRAALAGIDSEASLEHKVGAIMEHMRARFTGMFGIMRAIGHTGPPTGIPRPTLFVERVTTLLAPDLERLRVPAEDVSYLIRLVMFASSIDPFNDSRRFTTDELIGFMLYGIAGRKD